MIYCRYHIIIPYYYHFVNRIDWSNVNKVDRKKGEN